MLRTHFYQGPAPYPPNQNSRGAPPERLSTPPHLTPPHTHTRTRTHTSLYTVGGELVQVASGPLQEILLGRKISLMVSLFTCSHPKKWSRRQLTFVTSPWKSLPFPYLILHPYQFLWGLFAFLLLLFSGGGKANGKLTWGYFHYRRDQQTKNGTKY